ncbi:MAG: hypothetical protein ACRDYB_05410 [Acidimicrobiales bacterium]
MGEAVAWSDGVDEVITGDLTVAAAYLTAAGGAVVTAVCPCGIRDREAGSVAFTTSLGFSKKLERIVRDPHVALAYHSRDHGFSVSPSFVLVQGQAEIDLTPSGKRLAAITPLAIRHVGPPKQGRLWNRILREYYIERVVVDLAVERVAWWPDLAAIGPVETVGAPWPPPPAPQAEPRHGTGPRVDMASEGRRVRGLPHRVLAYRGADGAAVVVPVRVDGHDHRGFRLGLPDALLPPGARRAGLLTHAYRPQMIGLRTRTFTGWLERDGEGTARYAPHTAVGFVAPPLKTALLVTNGVMAKLGVARARRDGTADRLRALQAARRGSWLD